MAYQYLPGAADDEESWASGLTPQLMWAHLRALLAAGPGGIQALARHLVQQQQQGQQGKQQHEDAAVLPGQQQQQKKHQSQHQQQQQQAASGGDVVACSPPAAQHAPAMPAALLPQQAEAGLHCLLPSGCRPAEAASVQQAGSGIFLLRNTGLAISSGPAAAAPAVWWHADAVLHLGLLPVAGMQQEPQPTQREQEEHPAAAAAAAAAASARLGPETCRYCWLPVRGSKAERHGLQHELPAALAFARTQLQQGRRLLLSCDSGLDASVCMAVACLVAFYRLDLQPGGGTKLTPVLEAGAASAAAAASDTQQLFLPVAVGAGFSKLAVRQHLAAVSACYPAARPTRGSLRQVFNFFLEQLQAAGADVPHSAT